MVCLIIDPDNKSRAALEKILKEVSQIDKVYTCSTAQQALSITMEHEIDLVLVDFVKAGANGLEFLSDLPYARPHLIVTSSKKETAIDAYEHEAVDFLLKPVKNTRLMKAIARVMKFDGKKDHKNDHLFVKIDGVMERIETKDIYLVEAMADYLKIHTPIKDYIVYSTFKRLMQNLASRDFIRIHRSFIVRLDKITSIEDSEVKVNNRIVPVSSTYRNRLMERLKVL